MDITIDDDFIKQVANNAQLELSDEEIETFKEDFKAVLSHFKKLAEAEVSDIPSFHPLPIKNNLREDTIEDGISHDDAMKNVDEENDGYIRGPKVI